MTEVIFVCDDVGSKKARDIPVGTYFTGSIGDYECKYFLRTFDGVVSLDKPSNTWKEGRDFVVKGYRPASLVNIEMEF